MELLAAIASGLVAVCAVATSTYNVYLQRQQVRAQVWPRLLFDTSLTRSKGFSLVLTNRGVGPAEVKRVRVTVDGKPAEDWPHAITTLLGKNDFSLANLQPMEDEIISPGMDLHALELPNLDDSRKLVEELQKERLDIELCYCSSLGECWIYGSTAPKVPMGTRPVDSCVPDATPFHSIGDKALGELLTELARDGGTADARAGE
jgi:hypothetical protein